MAVDREEQQRKLSASEQARLERYERLSARLATEGYRRHELTIGLTRANLLAVVISLPFMVVGCAAFLLVNGMGAMTRISGSSLFVVIIAVLVLVVVHELIHGFTWSFFVERHWGDIELGFIAEYLTPYCTATSPLPKYGYVLGALMPTVTLGLIPTIVAIATGNAPLLLLGFVMTMAGGGDMLIVLELLRYRTDAQEVLIYDHPTQAGAVVFER